VCFGYSSDTDHKSCFTQGQIIRIGSVSNFLKRSLHERFQPALDVVFRPEELL
jgi:hypothetical protein